MPIDPEEIIARYYDLDSALGRLLLRHSRDVATLALSLCRRLSARGVAVDIGFVQEAAMLHDIGIYLTDAPGIHCHGSEPYIRHGLLGRQLLEAEGLPRHALVCERHTGAGLSLADIERQQLPLPHRDMLPQTIEEQAVCYADKFYSKSHPASAKPFERVAVQMARWGADSARRFAQMTELFGRPDISLLPTDMNPLNTRMGQVKNLILLALADGKATEEELVRIAAVATRENLTQEQLDALIDNPDIVKITPPADEPTRRQYLRDMVDLMISDGEIHEKELSFCKIYALSLGFRTGEVGSIVQEMIAAKQLPSADGDAPQ